MMHWSFPSFSKKSRLIANTAQVKGRNAIDPIGPPGPELVARSYLSLALDFRHLHLEDILGEVASPVSRPLQIAKRDNWIAKIKQHKMKCQQKRYQRTFRTMSFKQDQQNGQQIKRPCSLEKIRPRRKVLPHV